MRSLLLRWGVAVVVGSLWGAIVSPATGDRGAKTASLQSRRGALRAVDEGGDSRRIVRRQSDEPLIFF